MIKISAAAQMTCECGDCAPLSSSSSSQAVAVWWGRCAPFKPAFQQQPAGHFSWLFTLLCFGALTESCMSPTCVHTQKRHNTNQWSIQKLANCKVHQCQSQLSAQVNGSKDMRAKTTTKPSRPQNKCLLLVFKSHFKKTLCNINIKIMIVTLERGMSVELTGAAGCWRRARTNVINPPNWFSDLSESNMR